MSLKHQALALLVTFIWGTNFVFIKWGLDELPPFLFATLRFILVAFPLIFFLPKPDIPWKYLASYGFLLGFGQFGLLFWAMQADISPGMASLVIQTQVFITILLAWLVFNEVINYQQMMALAIAIIGVVVIGLNHDHPDHLPTTWIGLVVTLMAALSWSGANLINKITKPDNALAFLAWSSLFAIPPLLLMSLYQEGFKLMISSLNQSTWISWFAVLWQSVGNTLIGYGLWNILLNRYPAAIVTPWALLVPIFGLSASWLLLNEALPIWKWIATALIMTGLIVNLHTSTAQLPKRQ